MAFGYVFKKYLSLVDDLAVDDLTGMLGMMNINLTKEQLLDLNEQLNKIKKPKK